MSQITSASIVYLNVCSGTDQRKHQSSVSLAFVRGIHRGPVNSPHKRPVTRKISPFDDVIMVKESTHDNGLSHVEPHNTCEWRGQGVNMKIMIRKSMKKISLTG